MEQPIEGCCTSGPIRVRTIVRIASTSSRFASGGRGSVRLASSRPRVVATVDDYTAVYALVSDLIAEGLEATVSPAVRETVENVGVIASSAGSATVLRVARALGIDKSAASRRCTLARRSGYIRNEEPRRGSRLVTS